MLEAFSAKAQESGLPGSLLGHYTFTDISTGFFSAARQRFAAWEGMMDFKPLDIEEDPSTQSINEGHYDLVVASMVLHATKNLHNTLSNVRKTMKPGGKLVLAETTQDRLDMQLIFGTLPGWWLSEEEDRQMSPNVPASIWDKVLRETGFSGLDIEMRDCEDGDFQMCSVMVSTAVSADGLRGPISIVQSSNSTPPGAWLSELRARIQNRTGIVPSIVSMDELHDQSLDSLCIFTAEMERPLVSGLEESTFESLRNILLHSRDVLWLSCGGLADDEEPYFAATQGLLRTLRLEDTGKRYVHLDFARKSLKGDNNTVWTSDKMDHIIHVLQQSFDEGTDVDTVERSTQ